MIKINLLLTVTAATLLTLSSVTLAQQQPSNVPPETQIQLPAAPGQTDALANTCGPDAPAPPAVTSQVAPGAQAPASAPGNEQKPEPLFGDPSAPNGPNSYNKETPALTDSAAAPTGAIPDKLPSDLAAQLPKGPPPLPSEVVKRCAGDLIRVRVSARIFGHKMGDVFPVQLTLLVGDEAAINFDTFDQHKLTIDRPTQFEWAGAATVAAKKVDGFAGTEYDITLQVRRATPETIAPFSIQLHYAVGADQQGKPLWQVLTTPYLRILQAVDGPQDVKREMTPGNIGFVQPRLPWAVPLLAVVVVLLILAYPVLFCVRTVNRVRPLKTLPRHLLARRSIELVRKNGDQVSWSADHYRHIRDAMRAYLRKDYPHIQTMTLPELEDLPDEHVKTVFRLVDRALTGKELSRQEHDQLLREVEALLPRPFTH